MTATTAALIALAPTTPCATCGALFTPRNDAQLYCDPTGRGECRRLAARLSGLRDAAHSILDNVDSAGRGRAVYGLRRVLAAAVTADADLPNAAEKADRAVDADGVAVTRRRRWCACCRAELVVGGRGRPSVSCRASSGRTCARFRNRAQEAADLADAITARAAADGKAGKAERARRAMLRTVTEINAEIGIF